MTYLGGNEGLKRVFRHGRASEAAERDPDTVKRAPAGKASEPTAKS